MIEIISEERLDEIFQKWLEEYRTEPTGNKKARKKTARWAADTRYCEARYSAAGIAFEEWLVQRNLKIVVRGKNEWCIVAKSSEDLSMFLLVNS